jgi:acyl-CoA thioesterase I
MFLLRFIFLLICLFTLAGIVYFFFWPKEEITNLPLQKQRRSEVVMVAIGDSLVEGVGAAEGGGFVDQLSQKIAVPIRNYGISGNTSAQTLARMDDALEQRPDVVIILVGGNDALRKIPKIETFRNIEQMIVEAQKQQAAVLLVGIQSGVLGDAYRKEFNTLAKTYKTLYVPDILDGLIGDSRFMSDAVHPNKEGYGRIAERVYTEIWPALKSLK